MDYVPDIMMIVDADQRDALVQMLVDAGIEGCAGMFGRPVWDEGTALVYESQGQVDLAKSPPPVAYISRGWVHMDVLDLLPEGIVVPPPAPQVTGLP